MPENGEILNLESHFNDAPPQDAAGIDFSLAIPLKTDGSVCDSYVVTLHNRRLFVKRLKSELRGKPFFRAALEKEYEIGRRLCHPSIPTYVTLGEDFIAMDFIEAQTLAEMIKQRNPWLEDEGNIRKLFLSLLDVVSYLHRHNITHCDLKPDNLLITNDKHNLMVVDFDKCYTDWLDTTSGAPQMYELDMSKKGSREMDFHAMAMLVDLMNKEISSFPFRRFKKFRDLCRANNPSEEKLLKELNARKSPIGVYILFGVLFAGVSVVGGILIGGKGDRTTYLDLSNPEEVVQVNDSDSNPKNEITGNKDVNQLNNNISSSPSLIIENQPEKIEFQPHQEKVSSSGEKEKQNRLPISDTELIIRKHLANIQGLIEVDQMKIELKLDVPTSEKESQKAYLSKLLISIKKEASEELEKKYPEYTSEQLASILSSSPSMQEVEKMVNEINLNW